MFAKNLLKIITLATFVFAILSMGFMLMTSPVEAAQTPPSNCSNLEYNASGGSVDTYANARDKLPACTSISNDELGFKIPSLGDLLTFAIRAFFVIAGLAALFYLLLGALAWVTSGGDKDAVTAAREKIQAAVLGMILVVAVLAIIWTLEQVIFNRRICLGLSCPLTLPGLLERTEGDYCCVCVNENGKRKKIINTSFYKCEADGSFTAL